MKPCNLSSTASARSGEDDQHFALDDDEFAEEEVATSQRLSTSAARRRRRQRAAERSARGRGVQGKEDKKPERFIEDHSKFSEEYVAELSAKLEAGGEGMAAALEAITGNVWQLSREAKGCRLVQLALHRLNSHEVTALALEMKTKVREALSSPHANYVVQEIIKTLPPANATFIAEEIQGVAHRVARHKFGCRIICRLVESGAETHSTRRLIEELLDKEAGDLCRHSFGHHVVQAILEHGDAKHMRQVATALMEDPVKNAMHRSSSYVIEKALKYCSPQDQKRLKIALGNPATLGDLATSQYGCYVARELLRCPSVATDEALITVKSLESTLATTTHGLRLLEELGMAAPGSADALRE